MSRWVEVALDDIAESVDYGVTASATAQPSGPKFLRITDIQNGVVDWSRVPYCECDARAAAGSRLQPGDIVFARTGATTGKSFLIRECPSEAVFASYLIRVRVGDQTDPAYVSHYFQSSGYWAQITSSSRGAAQPGVNASSLRALQIPLPPLAEQRRIADVLDRAEALRAKRRAALAGLTSLGRSIFDEMFGNPETNPRGWVQQALIDVLLLPLRNGLSPSKAGTILAKVLTLSAVTGSEFDPCAWKTSTFHSPPPPEQSVHQDDFLICRGNGNIKLVGKGFFPLADIPDVTFPDTVIAGRINTASVEKAFLQHVWNSGAVRRQIEALARTTNGTYKVNQATLEQIHFIAPPSVLQREFSRRAEAVERMKAAQRASLAELDALFASLQHRAFRGEL